MRRLIGIVLIGLAAVAVANAMVNPRLAAPSRPAVAQIDFAKCNRLAEMAGAAMALRQLGSDESAAMRQDMSGEARRIVSRAYGEPIAATGDARALAARNFADSVKHECIRG
ncbi:hypothetical protein [Mesorhizobium sp. INR15]|uniref:hypothetical protein n=1 Tax=Mesorhizobium sp. INR15 TaxID=2654248 RepID=UPI0018965AE1|nr:hypothetical protein [Mesorhizobium sp. INR15]QPC91483.1 hypothetical protein GA829_13160 [Mesorhizobium sp. INR15]